LSDGRPAPGSERRAGLVALADEARPELHRYCARLMGSVIEGEDVVQDALVRALAALPDLDEATPLRPWLFRIAHNRALDLLRSRALRMAEPMDAAPDVADPSSPDPADELMRQQPSHRRVALPELPPPAQRRHLKDARRVMAGISTLLDLTGRREGTTSRGGAPSAVVSHRAAPDLPPASPQWRTISRSSRRTGGLGALAADDVRLVSRRTPPASAPPTSACSSPSTRERSACGSARRLRGAR
jgi:RNA polymerase sigma-70 factor (ECF subfamily)